LWSAANLIEVGCQSVNAIQSEIIKDRTLLKIIDILGQAIPYRINTPIFYIYDDGTLEKRIVIE
jgi:hypothetical protein